MEGKGFVHSLWITDFRIPRIVLTAFSPLMYYNRRNTSKRIVQSKYPFVLIPEPPRQQTTYRGANPPNTQHQHPIPNNNKNHLGGVCLNTDELKALTVQDLRAKAKEAGHKNVTRLKKDELIQLLS